MAPARGISLPAVVLTAWLAFLPSLRAQEVPAAAGFEELPSTATPAPAPSRAEADEDVPLKGVLPAPASPAQVQPAPVTPSGARPKYTPAKAWRMGMGWVGGSVLGLSYFQMALIGGAQSVSKGTFYGGCFIPLVGPVLLKYNDPVTETLFVMNALGQMGGAILLVAALVATPPVGDRVTVAPLFLPGGGGLALGGFF